MKTKIDGVTNATFFIAFCLTFITSFNIVSNPTDQLKAFLTKENYAALKEKNDSLYPQRSEYQNHSYLDPAYKELIPPMRMTLKVQHDVDDMLPRIVNVKDPKMLEKYLDEIEFTINGQKLIRKDTTTVLVPINKPINVGITVKRIISLISGTANTTLLKILDFLPIHISYDFPIKQSSGQEISLTELIWQQQELINFIYEQSRQAFSFKNIISFAQKYFDWSNLGFGMKFTLPTVSTHEIES